jgi:hypothetical protein
VTNLPPPWPARGFPAPKLAACEGEAQAERSEALSPIGFGRRERQEQRRTNKDFVRRDDGAPSARRIRRGSNPVVEGPRRGTKPREGRPEARWKRRVPVRTHLRSNASKVEHHGVTTRTSAPATVTTDRSRLRGKRTPGRQRSWRHETAAGGGNLPRGMKRAAGKRHSRDHLHTDQKRPVWGDGSTRLTKETQRTPGSAAGCNKPANPAPVMAQSSVQTGRSAEKTGGTVQNGEVGTGSRRWHFATEATAAMPAREWTPGNRSMEGQRGTVDGQRYGSDVGGERRNRDESQERGSETTDRGI